MDLLLTTSIELSKVNILLALLFSIGWLVIALPLKLYYRSSIRFSLANLLFSISLIINFQQQSNADTYLYVVADIVLLISFIIYNLALKHLFRLANDATWLSCTIIGVILACGVYLAGWISAASVSLISLLLLVVVMLATVHMKFKSLHSAFTPAIACILSLGDALLLLLVMSKISFWMWDFLAPDHTLSGSSVNPSILLWIQIVLIIILNTTAIGTTISRLIIRMKYLAEHDQLTGLLNRRAIQSQITYQFSLYQRYQRTFSILMLDIDHFKQINDTYGHCAGDVAISHTANVIKQQVRESDLVARFGGEEFIILLPNQSSQEVKMIADKICLAISQTSWRNDAAPVTVSIGCADVSQASNADKLLKLADHALYTAKANGRNQAIVA